MKSFKVNFIGPIWRFVYIYLGIGYILQMIRKPKEGEYTDRAPSQFIWWVIGIYAGIFGIAFQKYENRINRLENRYNSLIQQLGGNNTGEILTAISDMQTSYTPLEPAIWPPNALISLTDSIPNSEIWKLSENTILNWSEHLSRTRLENFSTKTLELHSHTNNLTIKGRGIEHLKLNNSDSEEPLSFREINVLGCEFEEISIFNSQLSYLNLDKTSVKELNIDYSYISNSFIDLKENSKWNAARSVFYKVQFDPIKTGSNKSFDYSGKTFHLKYNHLGLNKIQNGLEKEIKTYYLGCNFNLATFEHLISENVVFMNCTFDSQVLKKYFSSFSNEKHGNFTRYDFQASNTNGFDVKQFFDSRDILIATFDTNLYFTEFKLSSFSEKNRGFGIALHSFFDEIKALMPRKDINEFVEVFESGYGS
jgi:uncharacterized protein YjbI with pentapeptide repeats